MSCAPNPAERKAMSCVPRTLSPGHTTQSGGANLVLASRRREVYSLKGTLWQREGSSLVDITGLVSRDYFSMNSSL